MPEVPTQVPDRNGLHPVTLIPGDEDRAVEDGLAVCLSGGGYRAMLFHAGVIWRLLDSGLLNPAVTSPERRFKRLSSVSGGSITSGLLGLKWRTLDFSSTTALLESYRAQVIAPLQRIASVTLAASTVKGVLRILDDVVEPGSVNEHIARAYDKHLFDGARLDRLPADPRWVINATNLQSGALWRFMSPYMRDWRVGENRRTDKVTLAQAVAASAAFPPVLSPARLSFEETDFTPHSGAGGRNDLQHPPFTTQIQLTDGGVYDNLGLETTYKRYRTLLVSDAGSPFPALPDVPRNWAAQGRRAIDVVDHQVRALRVRLLLSAFAEGARKGAYWAIDTDVASLPAVNKLPCDYDRIRELAELGTALGKLEPLLQQRLINLGYAVTDASVRSWFDPDLPAPTDFPFAGSGI